MNVYMLLMFGMTFLTAISQVLLKKSANQTYKSWIYEYLNWRGIVVLASSAGTVYPQESIGKLGYHGRSADLYAAVKI